MNYQQIKASSIPEISAFLIQWAIANDITLPVAEDLNFASVHKAMQRQLIKLGEPPRVKIWTEQTWGKQEKRYRSEIKREVQKDCSVSPFSIRLDRLEMIEMSLLTQYLDKLSAPTAKATYTPTPSTIQYVQSSAF